MLETVLPLLATQSAINRVLAIDVLVRCPIPGVEEEVLVLLSDSNAFRRAAGVSILGHLEAFEHLGRIMAFLADPSPEVRDAAALAFGQLWCRAETVAKARLLERPQDPSIRHELETLQRHREESLPSILPLLNEKSHMAARVNGIAALWFLGAKEHVPAIAARLSDTESRVRVAAVNVLFAFRAFDHLEEMARLLQDKDPGVRLATIRNLGPGKESTAYRADITALLKDPEWAIRNQAKLALKDLAQRERTEQILLRR